MISFKGQSLRNLVDKIQKGALNFLVLGNGNLDFFWLRKTVELSFKPYIFIIKRYIIFVFQGLLKVHVKITIHLASMRYINQF